MNKYIYFLLVFALCSLSASAACGPGYQSATVLRVQYVSPGPTLPARAAEDDQSPPRPPAGSKRLVIFAAHGKQYGLRMPPGAASEAVSVALGDELCFRKEGTTIRVLTSGGKLLPGVAHPIREMPQTQ